MFYKDKPCEKCGTDEYHRSSGTCRKCAADGVAFKGVPKMRGFGAKKLYRERFVTMPDQDRLGWYIGRDDTQMPKTSVYMPSAKRAAELRLAEAQHDLRLIEAGKKPHRVPQRLRLAKYRAEKYDDETLRRVMINATAKGDTALAGVYKREITRRRDALGS